MREQQSTLTCNDSGIEREIAPDLVMHPSSLLFALNSIDGCSHLLARKRIERIKGIQRTACPGLGNGAYISITRGAA